MKIEAKFTQFDNSVYVYATLTLLNAGIVTPVGVFNFSHFNLRFTRSGRLGENAEFR